MVGSLNKLMYYVSKYQDACCRQEAPPSPIHEIIFSTSDKPKLLSQVNHSKWFYFIVFGCERCLKFLRGCIFCFVLKQVIITRFDLFLHFFLSFQLCSLTLDLTSVKHTCFLQQMVTL